MSLTQPEREEMLALLRDSEGEMLRLLNGVSDEQWRFKPAPDRWSIGETAEHVALIEPRILMRISVALNAPPNPDWEAHHRGVDQLRPGLLNRAGKVNAPEMLHPKSERAREEVLTAFREERAKTIAFAETTDAPLKRHFAPHPVLGNISAYSWLVALGLHTMRHNLQIAEVQNEPAYPVGNKAAAVGVE